MEINTLRMMAKINKDSLKRKKNDTMYDSSSIAYTEGQCEVWKIVLEMFDIDWEDI